MDSSSDDESTAGGVVAGGGRGGEEARVVSTPARPRNDRDDNSMVRGMDSSPASSHEGRVPPTPGGLSDQGSVVPQTPTVRRSNQEVAGTPLTPLSALQDEDTDNDNSDDDDDDDGNAQDQHGQDGTNVDAENAALFGGEEQHIRGTDVHLPTAAAAFVDFLRNFRSLQDSAKYNLGNRDGDSDTDSEEEDERPPPVYLERLRSLLTRGVIADETADAPAANTNDSSGSSSLDIDTMHLYYHSEACQRFYSQLLLYPMELVPLMDLLVKRELERLAAEIPGGAIDPADMPNYQVRPYNLRKVSNIRCLDPASLDSLVSVKGMIVRSSTIIPDLKVAHFMCTICGHNIRVTIDRGKIKEPNSRCPSCNTANTFQLVHNRSVFADKQLVRLQETPDEVPAGQTPASVVTFCFDDLVDTVIPGDKVEVTGVLRAQPMRVNPKITKVKTVYKTYIDVIHFRRITGMEGSRNKEIMGREGMGMEAQFTKERIQQLQDLSKRPDIYDMLTASLAPSIWELDNVKKGVLCMLFGGNHLRIKNGTAAKKQRQEERRMRRDEADDDSQMTDNESDSEEMDENGGQSKLHKRGDINILLCGDPGTSKSQLLSYVNKLSARGVYTSGKGSSAVGLTAAVVRDPETKELVLESGALVLSDLGICCIDEFDKMSDTTRSVLHEAMEQQTVSIAKAGIIATLNSRTSVLASANPTESRYNPSLSVVDNIKLPPTLLSRFDLIYLILDSPNAEHDRHLAQHLVGLYYDTPQVTEPPMDQDLLRDYIEYARKNIHPELSNEASEQLVASYLEMRNPLGNSGSNGTRTISATPRQLESLIRLSEALAKMRYSDVVTKADVREAVRLMKVATQAAATDPRTGRIDMDMITTGRTTADREMTEHLTENIKVLLTERRGRRMPFRDVVRELSEVTNTAVQANDVTQVLRRMEADGIVQFNERDQSVFVRSRIGA